MESVDVEQCLKAFKFGYDFHSFDFENLEVITNNLLGSLQGRDGARVYEGDMMAKERACSFCSRRREGRRWLRGGSSWEVFGLLLTVRFKTQ